MINKLSLSLIVIFLNLCAIQKSDSLQCDKLNFDKASLTGIEVCLWSSPFTIIPYSDLTLTVPLFQSSSQFVLSSINQGLSCGDSLATYTLDEFSEIEIAYYLDLHDLGAMFQVELFDENGVTIYETVFNARTTDWIIFKENLGLSSTFTQCTVSSLENINKILTYFCKLKFR